MYVERVCCIWYTCMLYMVYGLYLRCIWSVYEICMVCGMCIRYECST